jgi:hypothetical protein
MVRAILVVLCLCASMRGANGANPGADPPGDLEQVNLRALKMAIQDLAQSFPGEYTQGKEYLQAVEDFQQRLPEIRAGLRRQDPAAIEQVRQMLALQRKALLSNPLLDFERLLLIKRKPLDDPRRAQGDEKDDKSLGRFLGLPQQSSWQLQTMTNTSGWDNEIAVLSPVRPQGDLTTLYRPKEGRLVSEMDLHFEAGRLMFSMPDDRKLWQVFEIDIPTGKLRQISPFNQPDVHNFDSCYLPNDNIAFVSTAPFQGVPCNAGVNVGMLYTMDTHGSNVRQVCFEQDDDFCPTVMNDGRVLYLRWEYTDIPHVWARFLFTMNPDGTGQREFYGSGGYWPNAIFYARPIPNHPTKVVGIVTGHHVGRVGELILFDAALGRRSTDGVVQRIPGYGGKVEPIIQDKLTLYNWPKFLHPWPLSEKYFLVAGKPRPQDLWGIYLVDIFDNIVLIKEVEGYALLEPIPLRKISRPPAIAERVDLYSKDALMFVENVYAGPGLEGVPAGTVKRLRLFTYQFGYHGVAGINHRVGTDGPWEPKRVLGTVPVEKDGSAFFRVPANTPISVQPLDEQGCALQLMRSWATAMPGELVHRLPRASEFRHAQSTGTGQPTQAGGNRALAWAGARIQFRARGPARARQVLCFLPQRDGGKRRREARPPPGPGPVRVLQERRSPGQDHFRRPARAVGEAVWRGLPSLLCRPAPLRASRRSGKRSSPADAGRVWGRDERARANAQEGPSRRPARSGSLGTDLHLDRS